MAKCPFILKQREDYSEDPSYSYSYQIATGMWNSAMFCSTELQNGGNQSQVVMVVDANSIDAVVTTNDPDFVFIEGLWVTPAKMNELKALPHHAGRTWVIRIHSEIPFLASEGIAMDWISQYMTSAIVVAPNSSRLHTELVNMAVKLGLFGTALETYIKYLPNCYPTTFDPLAGLDTSAKTVLDVGCFGAFRPLKNHLQQVFIAARFAESIGKTLRFHTNCRYDAGGAGPAKNVDDALTSLGAEHVIHDWEDRAMFLQSLRDCDLLLQLSMSETFNIVAADNTLVGRPMLVSNEVSWAYPLYGDPQRIDDCVQKLAFAWGNKPYFIQRNRSGLTGFVKRSARLWNDYVA